MKAFWETTKWQFRQKPITAIVGIGWFIMGCANFALSSTTNMLLCFVLSTLFLNRLPERRSGES
jgi:hypothetical protein